MAAFLVAGGAIVLLVFLAVGMHSSKNSRDRQVQIQQTRLASVGYASYIQGGITTNVEEIIPNFARQGRHKPNWQELLLEPLNPKKLQAAGFRFTHVLMEHQNVGSLDGPQTPETVKIIVKSPHKNFYFRITQKKSVL